MKNDNVKIEIDQDVNISILQMVLEKSIIHGFK